MFRWYLIQAKPCSESIAERNLQRQGYEVYLPRLCRPVRRGVGWVDRIVPLFPRYLFLRIETELQSFAPVRSTLGVANVVRSGQNPTIVPDSIVDELLGRADPITGLHRLLPRQAMRAGSRVELIAGPFDGFNGIFEREAGNERAIVLLKILGEETRVCVPSQHVAVAMVI